MRAALFDWSAPPPAEIAGAMDVVLAADVLYDEAREMTTAASRQGRVISQRENDHQRRMRAP